MSDLISRQAAIDAIRKIYDSVGILGEKWAVDKCQRAIKDLPSAQPERKWIPVSERLPEKDGYYLTTTCYRQVYCDFWNGDNFDRTEMVIAWMPLPEPYSAERKEE